MRTDLSQATFIIPIRIESPDRLRNVITTTAFLLENFNTNIIIQEVDKHSVFEKEALPILEDIVEEFRCYCGENGVQHTAYMAPNSGSKNTSRCAVKSI